MVNDEKFDDEDCNKDLEGSNVVPDHTGPVKQLSAFSAQFDTEGKGSLTTAQLKARNMMKQDPNAAIHRLVEMAEQNVLFKKLLVVFTVSIIILICAICGTTIWALNLYTSTAVQGGRLVTFHGEPVPLSTYSGQRVVQIDSDPLDMHVARHLSYVGEESRRRLDQQLDDFGDRRLQDTHCEIGTGVEVGLLSRDVVDQVWCERIATGSTSVTLYIPNFMALYEITARVDVSAMKLCEYYPAKGKALEPVAICDGTTVVGNTSDDAVYAGMKLKPGSAGSWCPELVDEELWYRVRNCGTILYTPDGEQLKACVVYSYANEAEPTSSRNRELESLELARNEPGNRELRNRGRVLESKVCAAEEVGSSTNNTRYRRLEATDEMWVNEIPNAECFFEKYEIALYSKGHLFLVATPMNTDIGCPIVATDADFLYEELTPDKKVTFLDSIPYDINDTATYYKFDNRVITLYQFAKAIKKSRVMKYPNRAYDPITNNCATFILDMGHELNIMDYNDNHQGYVNYLVTILSKRDDFVKSIRKEIEEKRHYILGKVVSTFAPKSYLVRWVVTQYINDHEKDMMITSTNSKSSSSVRMML